MKLSKLYVPFLVAIWLLLSVSLPYINTVFLLQQKSGGFYLFFVSFAVLGLLLHLLITRKQFKKLAVFLVLGWILPALPTIIGRLVYRGDVDRLAYLPIGYFILYILFPELVLVICFLLSYNFVKSSARKAAILAVVLFSLLPLTFLGYSKILGNRTEQSLCNVNEKTNSASTFVYFINPIKRQELLQILDTYDLRLASMVIGIKGPDKSRNQIGPMFWPSLGKEDLKKSLLEILNDTRWPLSETDQKFIDAYEQDEPVVWEIKIEDLPLRSVLPFFLEYDRNQHKLGIPIDEFTGKPIIGDHNILIDWIRPKTFNEKLPIERCYPE